MNLVATVGTAGINIGGATGMVGGGPVSTIAARVSTIDRADDALDSQVRARAGLCCIDRAGGKGTVIGLEVTVAVERARATIETEIEAVVIINIMVMKWTGAGRISRSAVTVMGMTMGMTGVARISRR